MKETIMWNSNDKDSRILLDKKNLKASTDYGYIIGVRANIGRTSGKWYWEIKINNNTGYRHVGIANLDMALSTGTGFPLSTSWRAYRGNNGYSLGGETNNSSYGDTFTGGDIIGIALDLELGKLEFFKNGVNQGVSTNTVNEMGEVYPVFTGADFSCNANFGLTEFDLAIYNPNMWMELVRQGYKPYDLENANWFKTKKYLIKQNSNYYSISNNYIDLGIINNDEELKTIIDEHGYNDLSILTKELNTKKIPTKLENDYYKSFDINLNDIKDSINLIEDDDKKYIEYVCDNYKISDKIKKINNAKFEVLMKE